MPELIEYTWEIGPVGYGGMGLLPLSWQEIAAWQDAQGIDLDPFELDAVRELSSTYVDQVERSKKRDCPAPWIDPEQVNREAVQQKILQQFRSFNASRRKRK